LAATSCTTIGCGPSTSRVSGTTKKPDRPEARSVLSPSSEEKRSRPPCRNTGARIVVDAAAGRDLAALLRQALVIGSTDDLRTVWHGVIETSASNDSDDRKRQVPAISFGPSLL
jgi:hypothetical protein